jgi:nicotinamide riboside kinase
VETTEVIKIGILGAESTGKSKLACALAKHYHAEWVDEFAREFFSRRDINDYTADDLIHIAREQLRRETEKARNGKGLLFCDTTPITVKIWSELEFGTVSSELDALSRYIEYDFFLVLDNTVEWEPDRLRLNKFNREVILSMNIEEVLRTGKGYGVVRGKGESRFESAVAFVDDFIAQRRP